MAPTTTPDPLEVPCPRCGAEAGAPCTRPHGRLLPPEKAHADRKRAAASADAPADAAERLKTPEARELYRAVVAELDRRDDSAPWTRMLAFRAARSAEEARNAFEQAAESPLAVGSTGQEVAHPLWAVALRLEERVLGDLKALRMTPDSAGWVRGGEGDWGGHVNPEPRDELDELDELAAKRTGRRRRSA